MKRTWSEWAMVVAVGAASFGCSSDDASSTVTGTDATTGGDTTPGADVDDSDATEGDATEGDTTEGDATEGVDTTDGTDATGDTGGVTLGTIPEVAAAAGDFTSLVAAATTAGLVDALSGEGPFTVFAPTDAAFTKAGIDLATFDTPEEITQLKAILTYHATVGKVLSSDLSDGQKIVTLNGAELVVSIAGGVVKVGDATVTSADVLASNGVIHVIDTVLMPPAPALGTIPEVATAAGGFTSLLAAVTAAGLADDLSAPGPFTVFAPTDAAFTKAGIDLATYDTPEELTALANILLSHVVSGEAPAASLSDGQQITTLSGSKLSVSITSGTVTVGGATVTATDIPASNGLIHVIDTVILP